MREEEVVKTDDSNTQSNFSQHTHHAVQPTTSFAINNHTALLPNNALYLVNVIEFGSLLRPVAVAHGGPILCQPCQHHHHDAALLPHHLPEVRSSVGQRSLGCNVGRITRVMIRLYKAKTLCFGSHRPSCAARDAVSLWFQTFLDTKCLLFEGQRIFSGNSLAFKDEEFTFLCNVGNHSSSETAHHIRPESRITLLWKAQISHTGPLFNLLRKKRLLLFLYSYTNKTNEMH